MMKKLAISIIAALAVVPLAQAQSTRGIRVPSEDDILAKILPVHSPFNYTSMMVRYMDGDLSLTDEHYYYLYYGYAHDPAYDPRRELPGEADMAQVFSRSARPSREDALVIIEAGLRNMEADPFNPSNLNLMTYAYELAGDTLGARVSAARFEGVVRAIRSSGTGIREKSPWHILRFSHADDLAAVNGMKIVNRQVRSRDVEYLQFDKNDQRIKGWFFDFSRVYWKPYEGERVRRKSRWMFNGLPLGGDKR